MTDEHVLSEKNFGGRLVAQKRVCPECNREAGKLEREVASRPPLAEYVSRYAPLFNPKHRPEAAARLDDGAEARAQWTPEGAIVKQRIPRLVREDGARQVWEVSAGGEAEFEQRRANRGQDVEAIGRPVGQREHMQLTYGIGARTFVEWPRFGAKVALGIASLLLDERWLASPGARIVQGLFLRGKGPPRGSGVGAKLFPAEGVRGEEPWNRLADGEHLLGMRPDQSGEGATVWMVLFGVLHYEVGLPGALCPDDEPTWLLSPRGLAPERLAGDRVYERLMARPVARELR